MIVTNKDAPMCKLIKTKLDNPSAEPKVLLEHDPDRRLEAVIPFANDKFIAMYMEKVHVS